VVNIITRTSHYESFTRIGTGFILNDGLGRGAGHIVKGGSWFSVPAELAALDAVRPPLGIKPAPIIAKLS
jgi:hypothetical protein